MEPTPPESSPTADYGLRRGILSPMETLAQSVSTMAPTTTPAATIPLVCALAGNGTWLAYALADEGCQQYDSYRTAMGICAAGRTCLEPERFSDKVVVRAGFGMYYDRGELYSYLSPGFAEGVINGGPFGVNQTPPYVTAQACTPDSYYLGYIPTCPPNGYSLSSPWGPTLGPAPSGNPADITQYLPNQAAIMNGAQMFSFATYNRANKLPYTLNQTFDIQWQPRNDLMFEVGYVGNLGRHGVVPIPFNQPGIATPTNPIHPNSQNPQYYTYGYTLVDSSFNFQNLPNGQPYLATYEGGNVDMRVPYIDYSAESETYKAAGVSAYNALAERVLQPVSGRRNAA